VTDRLLSPLAVVHGQYCAAADTPAFRRPVPGTDDLPTRARFAVRSSEPPTVRHGSVSPSGRRNRRPSDTGAFRRPVVGTDDLPARERFAVRSSEPTTFRRRYMAPPCTLLAARAPTPPLRPLRLRPRRG